MIENVFLPMHGLHNLRNSLAAISVALELGMADADMVRGFAEFGGVKRRFTKTGEVNGITIIDDYGHHPVEIAATLSSARQAVKDTGGRVIAVVQPHRYSRVQSLFDDFCTCMNDADTVVITPIYEAGETPIEGINRDTLIKGIQDHGHQHVLALEGENQLAPLIAEQAKSGDFVVCLGAGSISLWANALPETLAPLVEKKTA